VLKGRDFMKIGFIGAGKVSTALGKYFYDRGIQISGYYSRSCCSAQNASRLTNSAAFKSCKSLSLVSDMLFITVPDDSIKKVCDSLALEGILKKGQIIIHTSGAHPSTILSSAKEKGCLVFSMHPLQSFASFENSLESLKNTVFSIEGDKEKVHYLEDVMKILGNDYFIIKPEDKILYHSAACIVSNYFTTLIDYGLDIFEAISIDRDIGLRALMPLIEGTLDNIRILGTQDALTGPIARGDIGTVENHIKEIKGKIPEKLSLYLKLGKLTVDLALREKLKDERISDQLKKIMEEEVDGD